MFHCGGVGVGGLVIKKKSRDLGRDVTGRPAGLFLIIPWLPPPLMCFRLS